MRKVLFDESMPRNLRRDLPEFSSGRLKSKALVRRFRVSLGGNILLRRLRRAKVRRLMFGRHMNGLQEDH